MTFFESEKSHEYVRISLPLALITISYGLLLADEPLSLTAREKPTDVYEARKLNQTLYSKASDARLDLLETVLDDGVAMRAAWERVRQTMVGTNERTKLPIDVIAINRFLGFLVGRLRIDIPDWWEELFLDARYRSNNDILFLNRHQRRLYGDAQNLVRAPLGIELREMDGRVDITFKGRDYLIGSELVKEAHDRISGGLGAINIEEIDNGNYLVALHSGDCRKYPIYCLTRNGNKKVWEATVWGAYPVVAFSSGIQIDHEMQFLIRGNRVYIFGVGPFSMYIESFERTTGKSIFRFSTSY